MEGGAACRAPFAAFRKQRHQEKASGERIRCMCLLCANKLPPNAFTSFHRSSYQAQHREPGKALGVSFFIYKGAKKRVPSAAKTHPQAEGPPGPKSTWSTAGNHCHIKEQTHSHITPHINTPPTPRACTHLPPMHHCCPRDEEGGNGRRESVATSTAATGS